MNNYLQIYTKLHKTYIVLQNLHGIVFKEKVPWKIKSRTLFYDKVSLHDRTMLIFPGPDNLYALINSAEQYSLLSLPLLYYNSAAQDLSGNIFIASKNEVFILENGRFNVHESYETEIYKITMSSKGLVVILIDGSILINSAKIATVSKLSESIAVSPDMKLVAVLVDYELFLYRNSKLVDQLVLPFSASKISFIAGEKLLINDEYGTRREISTFPLELNSITDQEFIDTELVDSLQNSRTITWSDPKKRKLPGLLKNDILVETQETMRLNVMKAQERKEQLSEVQEKAEKMKNDAADFSDLCRELKNYIIN